MVTNYYHSLPRTFVANEADKLENHAVEKRITYINRTHREVIICERSNLRIVIPPTPSFGKEQEVIIRVEYWIHEEKVKFNTELLLDRLRLVGDHLKIFRNAISCHQTHGPQFRGIKFCVEYPVSQNILDDYGGAVYFKEIDTVIALSERGECPNHPFSYEAEMMITTGDVSYEQPKYGLNIDIYINDPQNKYGERYVNLFGKVYCVRTVKLYDRREGIYLTKVINGKAHNVFFAFEEAEKEISLYRVEDEALTNGHVDIVLKKNLAELEHNNLVLKKQVEEAKLSLASQQQEFESRKLQLEKEQKEWQARKDREDNERKTEFERMRDFYERRSYERKDRTEAMKYIPTLIVGLGALIVGIKNILNSKDG